MTAPDEKPTTMSAGDDDDQGANPALDAVAHLQTAALEVIAAVRSFLDAAEEVVRNPVAVVSAATRVAGRARHSDDDATDGDLAGSVQRIPVSE